MGKQSLVQTWLAAIGLAPHILETFEAAGIVNPKDLAELEICHYPALGVQQASDRKKLFYLVQRVKLSVPEDDGKGTNTADITVDGVNAIVDDSSHGNGSLGNEPQRQHQQKDQNGNDNYESKIDTQLSYQNHNNNNDYSSHFDEDEDCIDHVLQEQYRPLLSSGDELSSREERVDVQVDDSMLSSSQDGVPSPPRSSGDLGGFSDDNFDIDDSFGTNNDPLSPAPAPSPQRSKREEAFISRRNARLSKLQQFSPKRNKVKTDERSSTSATTSTTIDSRESVGVTKKRTNARVLVKDEDKNGLSKTNISYQSITSNSSSRIRRTNRNQEKSKTTAMDDSQITSSPKKSSTNRKPFTERKTRGGTSTDTSTDIKTRRMSKRLQEKKAREILSSKGGIGNKNKKGPISVITDHEDQESSTSDTRNTNLSSSSTNTAQTAKKSSATTIDENDLDSILGDSFFPVSPDSIASDSSSHSKEKQVKSSKIPTLRLKRLATIPSGRVAHSSSLSSLMVDDDSIFPNDSPQTSSNSNKNRSQKTFSQINEKSTINISSARAKSTPKTRENYPNSINHSNRSLSNPPPEVDTTKSSDNQGSGDSLSNLQQRRKSMKPGAGSNGMVFVHGKRKKESWTSRVDGLREVNDQLYQDQLKVGRLDSEFEEEMRIRVVVRKRPMSRKEAAKADDADVIHPLQYNDYGRILVYQPKTRVDLTREVETLPFAFDNVFPDDSTNCQIYDDTIKNLIPGAFEGRWASVFAYGQTGSGKTFTMMGSTLTGIKARNRNVKHDQNFGLYLLAARDLFDFARKKEYSHFTIGASLFEIYGGKLFDLLNDRGQVKCLENHQGRVCFPGLSEHTISNAEDLMKLIEKGASNRSTGSTSANRDSSRSHAVLQLHLRKSTGSNTVVEHGRLTFIDLAGSERGADTDQASRTTRLEGAEINTSLLALKEVIRALATGDAMAHIPFRGSKLTQVLKESFVGKNARTVMVACVAPNMTNCDHTLNTLRYADRVKERNSETGELAEAIEAASKIHKKMNTSSSRPISAPPVGSDLSRTHSKVSLTKNDNVRNGGGDDDWLSALDDESDEELMNDNFKVSMDELNEVLKTPVQETTKTFRFDDEDIPTTSSRAKTGQFEKRLKPRSKQEAVAPLISSHRSIMSEMLGMVKQEMTLVNCTDEDRALIDDYLDELEQIQEKQLSMISTLRESLVEYYGTRPSDEFDDSFDALLSS